MEPTAAADNADLLKLQELIKDIEVAMLTTRSACGGMSSRPLQTLALDPSGTLVFFTAADSGKLDDLAFDQHVNVAYVDSQHGRYVAIRGDAEVDRDPATIERYWSIGQRTFFPEGKDDPRLVVLRVKVRDAQYWEAGNLLSHALDFARALASGEPVDVGSHGTLDPARRPTG